MSDAPPPPRRPILKLKIAPAPKPEPPPKPAPAPAATPFAKPAFARSRPRRPAPEPAPIHAWKCKPCGAGFTPVADAVEPEWARCPSCNARVGRLADFLAEPPNVDKLRARRVRR